MANLAETGIHLPLAAGFSLECISKIGFWPPAEKAGGQKTFLRWVLDLAQHL